MGIVQKLFGGSKERAGVVKSQDTALPQPARLPVRAEEFPFAVGVVTDKGPQRSQNEDSLFCFESVLTTGDETIPFGLFMIADGLGGQRDGQVASMLTVRTVAAHLLRTIYVPLLTGRSQDSESVPINQSLTEAVEAANGAIRRETSDGGSTLTAVLLLARTAYVAHVGDSRAYLVSDASVSQLTHDHSVVARLREMNQLSAEEAASHPQRHVLYKALGQASAPQPDIDYHTLGPHSHLLLCSDGLWTTVAEEEIVGLLRKAADPQKACAELVQLAITRRGDDNISVILLSSKD